MPTFYCPYCYRWYDVYAGDDCRWVVYLHHQQSVWEKQDSHSPRCPDDNYELTPWLLDDSEDGPTYEPEQA